MPLHLISTGKNEAFQPFFLQSAITTSAVPRHSFSPMVLSALWQLSFLHVWTRAPCQIEELLPRTIFNVIIRA